MVRGGSGVSLDGGPRRGDGKSLERQRATACVYSAQRALIAIGQKKGLRQHVCT